MNWQLNKCGNHISVIYSSLCTRVVIDTVSQLIAHEQNIRVGLFFIFTRALNACMSLGSLVCRIKQNCVSHVSTFIMYWFIIIKITKCINQNVIKKGSSADSIIQIRAACWLACGSVWWGSILFWGGISRIAKTDMVLFRAF